VKDLEIKTNPAVALIFKNYPSTVQEKMLALRNLVIETARETESIKTLEETLKWGEPSYISPIGSTIRMDWKSKSPNEYTLYFQCTSRLIETFKAVFKDTFTYKGKRGIVFELNDEIPTQKLKHCITAALIYHKVKHMPALGI